jgi:hypothetical protein
MRAAIVLLSLLAACVGDLRSPEPPVEETRTRTPPFKPPDPPGPGEKAWDRLELDSDEHLKGEIEWLVSQRLEFESDRLGTLDFLWKHVRSLSSPRVMDIARADLTTVSGPLRIQDDKVVVKEGDEYVVFARNDLFSIVRGGKGGRLPWTGKLTAGLTARAGNIDQLDTSAAFSLRRLGPATGIRLEYLGTFSRIEGADVADNQRLTARYDVALTRRWFLTPFSLELFRNPLQNTALRVSAQPGVGHYLYERGIDKGRVDWSASLLAGYRYTAFESSAPDDETFVTTFATLFEWDVTSRIDVDLRYDISVAFPETGDTNQNLATTVSWEIWGSFQLDITFVWNFVGQPRATADGTVPDRSDFRVVLGIGWEF